MLPRGLVVSTAPRPTLGHGLAFVDLYTRDGLVQLDRRFVEALQEADAPLAGRLASARNAAALDRKAESELLVALAPHLEDFIAALFGIVDDVRALEARLHELAPLYVVKRQFVQRKAMNAHGAEAAAAFDAPALRQQLEREIGAPLDGTAGELAFARAVLVWQGDPVAPGGRLALAAR